MPVCAAVTGRMRSGRSSAQRHERMTIPKMQRRPAVDTAQLAQMRWWAIGFVALLTASNKAWRYAASSGAWEYPSLERTHPSPDGKPAGMGMPPPEIPERGWKDILWRVYDGVTEARIFLIAAGVTFYLILGLFPGIAALVSIYRLFVDPQTMVNHLDIVASVAPGGAVDVLREQLTRLGQQTSTTLGVSFLVSLAVSLWTATSGIKAIFDGLNVAYGETEKRSFVRLTAIALLFTVGAMVFVLLSLEGGRGTSGGAQLCSSSGIDQRGFEHRQVADPLRHGYIGTLYSLPVRSEPCRAEMAVD
jgi:Virulence factor BrkB